MKLFITEANTEKKCGGCNWETETYYGIGTTLKSARKAFDGTADEEYGRGLCATCMCQMLATEKYKIEV